MLQNTAEKFTRPSRTLLYFALFGVSVVISVIGTEAKATPGEFKQCHMLCSNEQGRTELRLIPGNEIPTSFRWAFRLETAYITATGRYDFGNFNSREPDTSALALEFLPSLMFRLTPDIQLNFSIPFEVNHSNGVVIPSLHPVPGNHFEIAPGGILGSIQFRLSYPRSSEFDTWAGVGYKLSDPSGTDDISENLPAYPEATLDGLGSGSDDIYFMTRTTYAPVSAPDWRFGAGLEFRIHMLPRFVRLFGTTLDYQLWAEKKIGPRFGTGLRLTGFRTGLMTLNISQFSSLIASPLVFFQISDETKITGTIFGEVPGAGLNDNVLQTLGISLNLVHAW